MAQDLVAVVLCTLVVLLGFSLSFSLAFGDVLVGHSTLAGSLRAMFRSVRARLIPHGPAPP